MLRYIIVNGTHGATRHGDFDAPGSKFLATLDNLAEPVCREQPYCWSTALEGIDGDNIEWLVAGANLFQYAVPPLCPDRRVKSEELLVIAFSHGVQVALYAFSMGLKGRFISVNPPIREDMLAVARDARHNMVSWTNLYGNWKDTWAIFGAIRDGNWGLRRQYPENFCTRQVLVPGGHGAALREDKYYPMWKEWVR